MNNTKQAVARRINKAKKLLAERGVEAANAALHVADDAVSVAVSAWGADDAAAAAAYERAEAFKKEVLAEIAWRGEVSSFRVEQDRPAKRNAFLDEVRAVGCGNGVR